MNPEAFVSTLETEHETELSRLGSSKALYAITAGEMEPAMVLAAMADRARVAAETFDAWATDESADDAAATFTAAATGQREAAAALDAPNEVDLPDPGPLFDRLAALGDTVDRAAGLIAWSMVADATRAQAVGFFVGSADPTTADTFRELREDLDALHEDAVSLLGAVCDGEDDWKRALEVGGGIIEAAYEGYVGVLEDLGIAVKPIC